MMVEVEPAVFKKTLLSAGLNEKEVRDIELEFSKNNFMIEDEVLLDKFLHFGKDMFTIISLFNRLGVSKDTVIRMIEMRQKIKLGKSANIYAIEVDDL